MTDDLKSHPPFRFRRRDSLDPRHREIHKSGEQFLLSDQHLDKPAGRLEGNLDLDHFPVPSLNQRRYPIHSDPIELGRLERAKSFSAQDHRRARRHRPSGQLNTRLPGMRERSFPQ